MIFSSTWSRKLASAGTSPTRTSKTRSSRPTSGAGAHRSPRIRRKTSTCPSAFFPASCDRTSSRLSPTPLSVAIPLVLSAFRRRGLTGRRLRPAKARPVVRGACRAQTGEYGYTAQDREPEHPALAVLQVRERVAQHGDRNQYLSGDEKLRFVRAERAQAEERADQSEFRKADRAGGRSDDPSKAADLFQISFHITPVIARLLRAQDSSSRARSRSPARSRRNAGARKAWSRSTPSRACRRASPGTTPARRRAAAPRPRPR